MSFELIETVTLDTAAASIEFTSIPQDGTDLVLKVSLRTDSTDPEILVRINNDTTADAHKQIRLLNDSSTQGIGTAFSFFTTRSADVANTFGSAQLYFSNYTSSSQKSGSADSVDEDNSTAQLIQLAAFLYEGTSAITGLELFPDTPNFASGSTASLYKVTAA